ncbi:MAG TPA: hypothetical protein VMD74_00190 [Candidatus Methylomirabilis sp.]|nr:hypothetical protein [Candidatus Methylomirabilis sp.]
MNNFAMVEQMEERVAEILDLREILDQRRPEWERCIKNFNQRWNHNRRINRIIYLIDHIILTGASSEVVEKAMTYCKENFPGVSNSKALQGLVALYLCNHNSFSQISKDDLMTIVDACDLAKWIEAKSA